MSKKEIARKLKGLKRYRVFGQCYVQLPLDTIIEARSMDEARELIRNDLDYSSSPSEAAVALETLVNEHPDLDIYVDWEGWQLFYIENTDTKDGDLL
jgi:hypothetical protein